MVTGYYSSRDGGRLTIRGLRSYLLCFTEGVELLIMGTSVALYETGWSGLWCILGSNGAILARA